eukprot:6941122-Pyramimonas_sp.AAC.1
MALALQTGKYRKVFNDALDLHFGKHQDRLKELAGGNAADEHWELIVNIMKEAAKPFFERQKSKPD